MLVLAGCVQPALAPRINAAAARVLDRAGISLAEAPGAGCCGALRFHLNDQEAGRADMRALIDAWWPAVERGEVEAIVMTASGCGSFIRDYVHHLQEDPAYRAKAGRISALTRDLCEVVEPIEENETRQSRVPVAVLAAAWPADTGKVEALLLAAGYELTPVADGHLCCGSAGTYSILQPELSGRLREQQARRAALRAAPELIATANIGCLSHLQGGTESR
jgi:glycolate oxidase iron-sulfur subunit